MRSIRNRFVRRQAELPVDHKGRRDKTAEAQLKWELHQQFWQPIRKALDPHGLSIHVGGPANSFYSADVRLPPEQLQESQQLMRELVGVEHLGFGLFFKVRNSLARLLSSAMMHWDSDIAACAVVEFARLLAGGEPDPEYGVLPPLPGRKDERNEDDWEDEIDQLFYGPIDKSEPFHSSDHKMTLWVHSWERTIEDAARFEKAFPGMGNLRPLVERALQPVFSLDPVTDHYTITLAIEEFCAMLESPFMEGKFPTQPGPFAKTAA